MNFNEIIGHDFIKESLIDTVKSGKVSHAYIFNGNEGIGKKSLAITFARAILCDAFNDDMCEECNSCRLSVNNVHPDLKVVDFTIGEDGKQKASISVETIRQFKQEVYLRPFYKDRKIYILENAEKMTVEAQNAMLKIFEEPPSYITIILICNGLSKVLSTIKSRAVIYNFSGLKPKELEMYFDKYYNEAENKAVISRISDGSVSKMIELISDEDSLPFRKSVLKAFNTIVAKPENTSINDLFSVFMKNKDLKFDIIRLLTVFTMDMAYMKTGCFDSIVNIDMKEETEKAGKLLSVNNIFNIVNEFANLSEQLSKNANYKLAVINSLIKIREEIHG